MQADEIALARREARDLSPPSTGATAIAAGGKIEFIGHGRWEDPDDDEDDIAEDLRRYPIGGPVLNVAHAVAH